MNSLRAKLLGLVFFFGLLLYFNFPSFDRFFWTSANDVQAEIARKYEQAQTIVDQLTVIGRASSQREDNRIRLAVIPADAEVAWDNPALKEVLGDYFTIEPGEAGVYYLNQVKFDQDVFLSDFSSQLNQLGENAARIEGIELGENGESIIFKMAETRRLAISSPPINSIFPAAEYDWLYDAQASAYRAQLADPPNLINLGLDLQGGIYLDIGIDQQQAVDDFLSQRAALLERELSNYGIGFDAVETTENAITVVTAEADAFSTIEDDIFTLVDGFNVKQGETLELELIPSYEETIKEGALRQAMDVIRNRIDQLGVKEPIIQRRGDESIVVQVPGSDDSLRIKELITQPANLEFRMVKEGATANNLEGGELLYFDNIDPVTKEIISSDPVVVEDTVIMRGDVVSDARVVFDQFTGAPQISMIMKPEGARLFGDITSQNIGRSMAIILDGSVRSFPRINQAIYGGQASITGQFTVEEARDLAVVLRSGALPVELTVGEERVIGATLGEQSVLESLYALAVGFFVLAVFIVIFYAYSGVIAVSILVTNLLIVLACLAFFQATLTLPGMAGIILTIGMAVDANVLIFERIREELKLGSLPRKAIRQGFNRVAVTILDANLTTLMVAAVLFQFGTGSVRGFAITLAIGIGATIFGSLVISRWIYDLVYLRRRELERISI